MKVLITESKIKTLIQDKFGLDFTGDVLELNSEDEIIERFNGCFPSIYLKRLLSKYGPMYLIKVDEPFIILYQNHGNNNTNFIMDEVCQYYTEDEFMKLIGLESLGLNMDQFISIYK